MVSHTTLDKPYARKMDLVTRHWSEKHYHVVQGINLIYLLWTWGGERLPCVSRIYNRKEDGLTKNGHFRAMLQKAHGRGLQPKLVVFDSWYTGLENLKFVRGKKWHCFMRLKANCLVLGEGIWENRRGRRGTFRPKVR